MKLYQYDSAISAAVEIDDNGEITPDSQARIDALGGSKEEKALGIACHIKELEAEAAAQSAVGKAIDAVALEHHERAGRFEKRAEWYRKYLAQWLPADTKLEDARAKLSFRETRKLEIADGYDIAAVPNQFVSLEPKIQKADLKKYLEDGGAPIEGFAVVTNRHAVIK